LLFVGPMLAAAVISATAFAPNAAPAALSRPAVRCESAVMVEQPSSRRELFARGAAVFGLAAAQSASAKAGQFGKVEIFSLIGQPAISSPYQVGGPKSGSDATFGYAKSAGPILAADYESDVSREKAAFDVSTKIVKSQGKLIDAKTWWLVRDNLRGQAYNMKENMKAINSALPDAKKDAASKAYNTFWKEIGALDLACTKKELALAQKEYSDVLAALDAYLSTIA